MSANRSVQAAQRRRTGPTETVPTRGPQPSINSSQMFSSQSRQGQRPIQRQQQQQSVSNVENSGSIGNIGKMTLPQAITLITLRLGSLESKIFNMKELMGSGMNNVVAGQENMSLIDQDVITSIVNRLESLEKRSLSSNIPSPEINLIKQQIETLKQTIVQNKTTNAAVVKENKELKLEIENLKQELNINKELLNSIQSITMENNTKIMELSMNCFNELEMDNIENCNIENCNMYNDNIDELQDSNLNNNSEIIEFNLKEAIEGEINASLDD
jgi:hypothetical protein